jgi:hypothetical protein
MLTTQLPLLFEQRTAQHRLRWQPPPSGFVQTVAAQIAGRQAYQHALAIQPLRDRFNSQPISCRAKTSNMVAWTVRS